MPPRRVNLIASAFCFLVAAGLAFRSLFLAAALLLLVWPDGLSDDMRRQIVRIAMLMLRPILPPVLPAAVPIIRALPRQNS